MRDSDSEGIPGLFFYIFANFTNITKMVVKPTEEACYQNS